ncbi:MAG: glycosyltransferase family 4 protein [Gammaproteobacteria bacterium]|nr:glycosyltransferase family 4 protein [Gammaproteobacteria bacterium]MDH5653703.1 glycosyltransferase family 4 protein [Gammaproteobacteria bacterium]
MKIVIHSRFPSDVDSPRGGVETATLGLVRGLLSINAGDIHMVTMEQEIKQPVVESVMGVTVHRLPRGRTPLFLDLMMGPGKRQLENYIRSLNPDIVHYHETYGLCADLRDFPQVMTIHGFDSLNVVTEQKAFWRLRSKIWHWLEKRYVKRLKHIISITQYVRDEIEQLTDAQIYDIDNAINAKYFDLQRNEKPGRLFFAGWLNPRKNALGLINGFIKVIKSGRDGELHLAGEAKIEWYAKKIQDLIAEHQLHDKVKLLGRIPQTEVQRELTEASIFVLPSYQENAPMAIAEAMAVGVPVISSNLCGMPYMIDDKRTGFLVDPDDSTALAAIINQLIDNPDLRNTISAAGRDEAYKRYHPDAVANKTLAVYKKIIAEHRG